jgi:hypothetical protein
LFLSRILLILRRYINKIRKKWQGQSGDLSRKIEQLSKNTFYEAILIYSLPFWRINAIVMKKGRFYLSGYAVYSTTHHRLWLSTNQKFTGSRGAIYSLFHQPIEQ